MSPAATSELRGAPPDWPALQLRFGGVLLDMCAAPRAIAAQATGMLLVSVPAGAAALAEDAALRLAWAGVTAVPAEAVAARIARGCDPVTAAALAERWRRPILRAAGGVVVVPARGWEASWAVWSDVSTALDSARRVWVLDRACGVGDDEGVDF